MYTTETHIRVRYAETDQMRYVYYGNYGHYYEQARAEAIRSMGISYKQLEESGTMMPITRMNIKYIQPVYVNMKLELNAVVADFFDFIPGYEIAFTFSESESKRKVAKGKVLIKVL